jgi:hypothetical protein
LPFVQFLGQFVLPLQYLTWIGAGLVLIASIQHVSARPHSGPFRYVVEGIPTVARIRELVLRPTAIVNGQPTSFGFAALIELKDPLTGELSLAETASNEISSMRKDHLTTSFRVGDYVTAVYLPADPHKSLRLYGFLDLRPGLGIVRRDGQQTGGIGGTIGVVAGLFAFFSMLVWNLVAMSFFEPLTFEFSQALVPFAIGAVALGGLFLGALYFAYRHEQEKRKARNEENSAVGAPVELEQIQRHKSLLSLPVGFCWAG